MLSCTSWSQQQKLFFFTIGEVCTLSTPGRRRLYRHLIARTKRTPQLELDVGERGVDKKWWQIYIYIYIDFWWWDFFRSSDLANFVITALAEQQDIENYPIHKRRRKTHARKDLEVKKKWKLAWLLFKRRQTKTHCHLFWLLVFVFPTVIRAQWHPP